MSKLMPGSLMGRLSLLLVAAVFAAQVIAFVICTEGRSRVRQAMTKTHEADRLTTLIHVINASPKELLNDIIQAFGSHQRRYWMSEMPLVATDAMGRDEQGIAERVRNLLGDSAHDPRVIIVERTGAAQMDADSHAQMLPDALRISVQLANGNWLNSEVLLRLPILRPVERVTLYLLAASAVTISIVVIFAVRWITFPLTALADAADRIGRGHSAKPLAVSGASEFALTMHAFNIMQQRLSHFLMERLAMLAAISHDLRTPLTAARLRAEMIDDPEIKTTLIRSLTDMQRITETTLVFAREETLAEEPRIIDLTSLVEAIIEDYRAIGHDVAAEPHDPLPYLCKPALLRRALTNLIDNASKYGKRARIAIDVTKEYVRIMVDDEGPGLAGDQLGKVFEPFVRGDPSRSNETGGIGLGLSIARSVIRAHGGDVSLVNQIYGLRAEVVLPCTFSR